MECDKCGYPLEYYWKYCPSCGSKIGQNITEECTVSIKKSGHSDGYYVDIRHNGKSIIALGLDDKSRLILTKKKYGIKKAEGASISFNIFEK